MDCSTKSTFLVTTCIFLLLNRIGGQDNRVFLFIEFDELFPELSAEYENIEQLCYYFDVPEGSKKPSCCFISDPIKICELCQTDGFLDCNLTDKINIHTTMNCAKGCILGIDKSFENFDNVTMDNVNNKQICVFKNASEVTAQHSISLVKEATERYEALDTSTEGTFKERITADGSLDYQNDEAVENLKNPLAVGLENQPPPLNQELSCFVCKSSSDIRCLNMVDKLEPAVCSNASGCLTFYAEGNLMRDCASPSDMLSCQSTANSSCEICPNNGCNKMPWRECYQCSSQDNPDCALWANVTTVPTTICPVSNDNCLTRVTTDGDTVRNCSHLGFKCAQGEQCSVCDKPLCNVGVFPEDRLRCIQCQECENDQDPSSALPCAKYDAHEECFLYVTAKSRMIRGCVSNTTEMEQCRMNKPKCISCGDKNGCNSMPFTKDPVLSCSKCKSKDNPSCAWAQPHNTVKKCQNKVLYYLQETCMTEFDPVTQEAVRDCSFDNGVCTAEDKNCHTCSGNGCNRGNLKVQQCVQCNSELPDQIKCGYRAEGIAMTKCPQEVQLFDSKGCFVMTKGNFTIRGCKSSLKEEDLKFCHKEGKARCVLCEEDGCNIQLMSSSGWRNVPFYLLALVGGLFVTI